MAILVPLDDAGLGCRNLASKEHLPFSKTGKDLKWVVLKLAGSVGEGDLWKGIVKQCPEKLVVIVPADQLRQRDVRISRGLSWEATAEDLASELQDNPVLQPLLSAWHLIVTFRSDAAFWLDNTADGKTSMLVFDAANAEGEWAKRQGQGGAFGFLSCFTASVVRELCQDESEPDFEMALALGLGASRELRRIGHGRMEAEKTPSYSGEKIA